MRLKLIGVPIAAGLAIGVAILVAGVVSGPDASSVAGVSSQAASGTGTTAEFKVDGMFCSLCAANLGRVLGEQPGVVTARVDFDNKVAIVQYDPKMTTSGQLEKTIEESEIFQAELMSRTPDTDR